MTSVYSLAVMLYNIHAKNCTGYLPVNNSIPGKVCNYRFLFQQLFCTGQRLYNTAILLQSIFLS